MSDVVTLAIITWSAPVAWFIGLSVWTFANKLAKRLTKRSDSELNVKKLPNKIEIELVYDDAKEEFESEETKPAADVKE